MRCGRVSPISSRSSFEKLATLFEGSGTSCAERAYCKALDKLTAILVKDGVLHAVHLAVSYTHLDVYKRQQYTLLRYY